MAERELKMKPWCKARVPEGGRSVGFRECGNKAKPGSEWCHIHDPERTEEDPTGPAKGAGNLTGRRQVATYAAIGWAAGMGPVVRVPYQAGYGFITQAMAKQVDGALSISVVGVARKKDGTPGERHWDCRWGADKLVGPEVVATLLAELERQRGA